MQEAKQFKPVRVKATTRESAVEQALQMTGASLEEVVVEVLEESATGITVRVAPLPADAAQPAAEADTAEAPSETSLDEPEAAEPADGAQSATDSAPESEASSAAQQRACDAAQDLLARMGLDAVATLAASPEQSSSDASDVDIIGELVGGKGLPRTFIEVEGEDVGILIGKHGQTLRAFQYLLNLSLNNDESAENVYVMVDAGNYRSRRATALEKSAQNALERARREHRPVRLEPMPAHERRLVHLILQNEKDITTSSEGREPWRRVIVAPQGMRFTSRHQSSRHSRHNGGRKSR